MFIIGFATADEEGWEVLLEELKLTEVGVLGVFSLFRYGGFPLTHALPRCHVPRVRCDTGSGKPAVFGSRFSQFQVQVEPEQTRTPSQPLPTVYGFSVGP